MIGMLVAAAIAAATPAPIAADPAAEIAHALSPRETFRSMILMMMDRNDAGAVIAALTGDEPRADALLAAAAEDISFRHAAQWEANLAAAYRESLTPDQLAEVLAALRRDDRAVLEPVSARVGASFFRKSSALLKQASTEAIGAARAQASR